MTRVAEEYGSATGWTQRRVRNGRAGSIIEDLCPGCTLTAAPGVTGLEATKRLQDTLLVHDLALPDRLHLHLLDASDDLRPMVFAVRQPDYQPAYHELRTMRDKDLNLIPCTEHRREPIPLPQQLLDVHDSYLRTWRAADRKRATDILSKVVAAIIDARRAITLRALMVAINMPEPKGLAQLLPHVPGVHVHQHRGKTYYTWRGQPVASGVQ